MWSLGALLEQPDRMKFQNFVQSHPSKLSWPTVKNDSNIFEYMVNETGQWVHWDTKIDSYTYPSDSIPDFNTILVPNMDNTRTTFLVNTIAKQNLPVLLIGEPGTAKTVMIKTYLTKTQSETQFSKCFNFSYATTTTMFQVT